MITIPFQRHVLDNGLTVILHEDHSSPLVVVDLWYHVGSKDEDPGRTGFAHLFEHLMFMGSKNAPYPSFDATMEMWGGHNNGTTSNDRTNYYEVGPKNLLETFLWLEADRMATLADVITDDELGRQRKVVQNERRQSYENRPYGRAELVIPEVMYPPNHPYHWPTIGSHADLEAASVDDVRAFFARFYLPSNASLVIAGDFEPAQALALVNRYFGWQERRPVPRRATAAPATLDTDRAITLTDRVQLPRLRLAWHSPALYAAGDADLDLAAHILGGGKSSRLYKTLVFDRRMAQDAFAYQGSQMLGSLFQIGATAKPGFTLDDMQAAVDGELNRLVSEGPTAEELERARNTHLADFFKGLDHLQTRADLLNHYQHLLGDPGACQQDIGRYEAATVTSVQGALARVVAGRRLDLRVLPDDKPAAPDDNPDDASESEAA